MKPRQGFPRLRTDGPAPLAYSITDIIAVVGIGRATVYRLIGDGDLPAKKLGRRTVVLRADLDAWLASLPDAQPVGADQSV